MTFKETAFKATGYYGRYKAVMTIITGIVLIIAGIGIGIYFWIVSPSMDALWLPLILIVFGIVSVFWGLLLWKRYKSFLEGKFM